MILKYFNLDVTLKKLKKAFHIRAKNLVYMILLNCQKHGVLAEGYKNVDINSLKFPCIIHVVKNGKQHFITLFGRNKNGFLQADPSFLGESYISYRDLKEKYTGIAIFFRKNNNNILSDFRNKVLILKSLLLFSLLLY